MLRAFVHLASGMPRHHFVQGDHAYEVRRPAPPAIRRAVLVPREERQRAVYLAVFDVLAALARTRPVLYVLEDLHYADSASIELLSFVTARASGTPLLFLLTQRLGPTPEILPPRANHMQLVLQPRSDEEAARIAAGLTECVSEASIARIVARTDLASQECVDQLLLSALDEGGDDNITAIIVRCG